MIILSEKVIFIFIVNVIVIVMKVVVCIFKFCRMRSEVRSEIDK